jgi:hypothetical protein
MPIHCKRRWVQFKDQQLLDSHLIVVAVEICEVISGSPPEGITPENETKLRSRKKLNRDQSDEGRWKEMYQLLFLNEDVPLPHKDISLKLFISAWNERYLLMLSRFRSTTRRYTDVS